MKKRILCLVAGVFVALLPACHADGDLTGPDRRSYNGGMAGSGGVSTTMSDTVTARGIGMAGSGY